MSSSPFRRHASHATDLAPNSIVVVLIYATTVFGVCVAGCVCVFMLTKTLCHDLCCHIPAAVGSPEYRRVRAQQRAQESSDESDTEEGQALIEMKRRKRLETEIAQVEQRVRRMRRRAAIEEELRLRRENMAYLEQRTHEEHWIPGAAEEQSLARAYGLSAVGAAAYTSVIEGGDAAATGARRRLIEAPEELE